MDGDHQQRVSRAKKKGTVTVKRYMPSGGQRLAGRAGQSGSSNTAVTALSSSSISRCCLIMVEEGTVASRRRTAQEQRTRRLADRRDCDCRENQHVAESASFPLVSAAE